MVSMSRLLFKVAADDNIRGLSHSLHITSHHVADLKWQNRLKVGTYKPKLKVQKQCTFCKHSHRYVLYTVHINSNIRNNKSQWQLPSTCITHDYTL